MSRDKVTGFVEVGVNERGEVVVNLDRDRNGVGHLVFSPNQARKLAETLIKKAMQAEKPEEFSAAPEEDA